jgi:hypothetical protein
MKNIVLALILMVGTIGCQAQASKNTATTDTAKTRDNKPKVSCKVNKRYDEKGNLVGYDSTSVWSYSSDGSMNDATADSLMANMGKNFGFKFQYNFGDQHMGIDSLFNQGFSSPDYFRQQWQQIDAQMQQMMNEMGMIKKPTNNKTDPTEQILRPDQINSL